MSLLDEFEEQFTIMEKTRVPDGVGGFTTTWSDGAVIKLVQRFDSSMQAVRAQKDGVTSVYTFLGDRTCGLVYHDVVKRKRDGQVFRITSHSGESVTPNSASFSLTSFTAERWVLT